MITDKLEIERLLSRLTTYIANKLHLSTMAAVGAVCMSKVANELAGGKIPEGTTFEELSERLLKEVTMAGGVTDFHVYSRRKSTHSSRLIVD